MSSDMQCCADLRGTKIVLRSRRCEHRRKYRRGLGFGKQESLCGVAPQLDQGSQILRVIHPLGAGRSAKAMRKLNGALSSMALWHNARSGDPRECRQQLHEASKVAF
jgi:hypothetical protein